MLWEPVIKQEHRKRFLSRWEECGLEWLSSSLLSPIRYSDCPYAKVPKSTKFLAPHQQNEKKAPSLRTARIYVLSLLLFKASQVALMIKNLPANAGDPGSIPGSGRFPWRRKWQPTAIFLPAEFHGQRGLVGYNPWGHKESDTTGELTLSLCML